MNRTVYLTLAAIVTVGCLSCAPDRSSGADGAAADMGESWAVTAWGDRYEIFPEVDPLVVGQSAAAHTHVTVLSDFSPLAEGHVEIVLSSDGREAVFSADQPARPGIFNIEIRPENEGEFELAFRIDSAAGAEEVPGGRVRVGTPQAPGGLVAPASTAGGTASGEPLPFLKEQQWRTDFATAWTRVGSISRSVSGLAKVRPLAGGEATLTAPVDGVVRPDPWPYPGLRAREGTPVFRLVPNVEEGQSLAALEAQVSALEVESTAADARLHRLQELLKLDATSRREVEEAETRSQTLTARLAALRQDLETARSAREGGGTGAFPLRAPFDGEIANVLTSPGAVVSAGDPLARLVRTDVVWLEVALSPSEARLAARGVAGVTLSFANEDNAEIPTGFRLVSIAPEVDRATGMVPTLVEVPPDPALIFGTTVNAQLALVGDDEVEGIIAPASAVIDDGGVPVVYVQLSGEEFGREEVQVRAREGDRLLLEGLTQEQRLVLRGGDAIRRSSLMGSGAIEGHVH